MDLPTADEAFTQSLLKRKELQERTDRIWREELPGLIRSRIERGEMNLHIPPTWDLPSDSVLEDLRTLGYSLSKLPTALIIYWTGASGG